jgi:hypothetical protein
MPIALNFGTKSDGPSSRAPDHRSLAAFSASSTPPMSPPGPLATGVGFGSGLFGHGLEPSVLPFPCLHLASRVDAPRRRAPGESGVVSPYDTERPAHGFPTTFPHLRRWPGPTREEQDPANAMRRSAPSESRGDRGDENRGCPKSGGIGAQSCAACVVHVVRCSLISAMPNDRVG